MAPGGTGKQSTLAERPQPRRLRVLIVEDQRDQLITLGLLCRDQGMEVEMLRAGAEVPSMVARFKPDVVLLDIGLPDRSGFDLAEELTQRYGDRRPVLIAVTAYSSEADRQMAKQSGFDDFITKPYDPQTLLRRLAVLKPK